MRLEDKVCIITGAGKGMGRAAALIFAREGAKGVVADVLVKEGEETVDLVKKAGGDAAFIQVDMTKTAEVEAMAKFAVDKYGRVNVLYNNAGIHIPSKDHMVTEVEEEIWDRVIAVNLKGVFLCCKYVIPEMIKSGGGSIINVASEVGLAGFEFPAYCSSKGGVIALTRSTAREYANKNIRVNAICPGAVDTDMFASAMKAREARAPEFPMVQRLLGRISKPEEIANVALFLASDEASFMTGAIVPVDGGLTSV